MAVLVLSRKRNEKIIVRLDGKEVIITVVEIDGNKIRIGFDAPQDVTILRDEIKERYQ